MLKDLPHGFYNGDPVGIWQPVYAGDPGPPEDIRRVHPASINRGDDGVTVRIPSGQDRSFSIGTKIADITGGAVYDGVDLPGR